MDTNLFIHWDASSQSFKTSIIHDDEVAAYRWRHPANPTPSIWFKIILDQAQFITVDQKV